MGYCVSLNDNNLEINKDKEKLILMDLKNFFIEALEKGKRIAWINEGEVIRAKTLEDAFEEIGYILCFDEDDDSYSIDYMSNEKIGNEIQIFNSIAKHIDKGTYLEYVGEDGELFRLVFSGEDCSYKSPKIIWE